MLGFWEMLVLLKNYVRYMYDAIKSSWAHPTKTKTCHLATGSACDYREVCRVVSGMGTF